MMWMSTESYNANLSFVTFSSLMSVLFHFLYGQHKLLCTITPSLTRVCGGGTCLIFEVQSSKKTHSPVISSLVKGFPDFISAVMWRPCCRDSNNFPQIAIPLSLCSFVSCLALAITVLPRLPLFRKCRGPNSHIAYTVKSNCWPYFKKVVILTDVCLLCQLT